jgi:hypothetical protein
MERQSTVIWKEETFPEIQARAKKEGAAIFFADFAPRAGAPRPRPRTAPTVTTRHLANGPLQSAQVPSSGHGRDGGEDEARPVPVP